MTRKLPSRKSAPAVAEPGRLVTKGSGITERQERIYNLGDPVERDAWIDGLAFTFADAMQSVKALAKECLRKAEEEMRTPKWDDDSSPESFAFRINRNIDITCAEIKRGDAESAARFALEVGRLCEQARIKFGTEWEKFAIDGKRRQTSNRMQLKDAREAKVHKSNEDTPEKYRAFAMRVRRLLYQQDMKKREERGEFRRGTLPPVQIPDLETAHALAGYMVRQKEGTDYWTPYKVATTERYIRTIRQHPECSIDELVAKFNAGLAKRKAARKRED